MKHKVIFFDADGVVLKGEYVFTDMLAERFGLKKEKMLPFFKGPFLKCSTGEADVKEELAKVLSEWGWSGTVDALMRFWFEEATVFDASTVALAQDLSERGVTCYVTTGQEAHRGELIKSRVGHGRPFADVFYSAEVGFSKKDPRFFEACYKRVQHLVDETSDILVIDDSQKVIDIASQLGFDTLLCTGPEDLEVLG